MGKFNQVEAIRNQLLVVKPTGSYEFFNLSRIPGILWKFSRPHTIIGTSLQVLTAYFLVTVNKTAQPFFYNLWENRELLFYVWLSAIAVNIYVVGLNQIFDRKIDQVNKPFLPLAAGELSELAGWFITLSMGLAALVLSYLQGIYLFCTISGILVIGSIYSLPQTYLKGNPIGAALAISVARGLVLNLGAFLHFRQTLLGHPTLPFSIIAFALFNFGFGIVIALMKDAPDLTGDKLYGVQTLAVRIGARNVFQLALTVLTAFYLFLSTATFLDFSFQGALFLALSHLVILAFIWSKARGLDYESGQSVYSFYMLIWKFFYLEFGLFCLAEIF